MSEGAESAVRGDRSFVATLVGDGRSLVVLSGLALLACGAFAIFLAATGKFLPHDVEYLGMTSQQLCTLHACRIVHFMIHDRVSFGGVLVAIGIMYVWLAEFPLRRGEGWAWWALAASSIAGLLSFLAYLGYGYLDTWHGVATMGLLPLFGGGLALTRGVRKNRIPRPPLAVSSPEARGRAVLVAAMFGMMVAGATITTLGSTLVFVPQDLEFLQVNAADLRGINPRLVPLIAHDRAGFGGALLSAGIVMFFSVLYGRLDRSLCEALALSGAAGFATAIGVHPLIGYTSVTHLGPAVVGCLVYAAGLFMAWPRRVSGDRHASSLPPP